MAYLIVLVLMGMVAKGVNLTLEFAHLCAELAVVLTFVSAYHVVKIQVEITLESVLAFMDILIILRLDVNLLLILTSAILCVKLVWDP